MPSEGISDAKKIFPAGKAIWRRRACNFENLIYHIPIRMTVDDTDDDADVGNQLPKSSVALQINSLTKPNRRIFGRQKGFSAPENKF